MKYIAILDSENEFTEEVINDLKNTGFLGDNPRYAFVIDDIQERKVGKWIDGHCTNCGCDVPAYIIDWEWKKDMDAKWCPQCGIEMVGAENG